METEHKWQQQTEVMRGQPIEEIVQEQNMPRPVERWTKLKIMSPSSYLAAAVYYFLFNMVNQKKTVANQIVADLFKISRSNLHRITSSQKYTGGSTMTGRKIKSLQELEEHGESMVKIAKVNGKTKQKVMVMKTITTPKLIPLPFLDKTPASGMRRAHKKKEEDDTKPMVHE